MIKRRLNGGRCHMVLTDNAIKVLERRYLAKDENGKLTEDAEGMFRRVAKAVAAADVPWTDSETINDIEEDFL